MESTESENESVVEKKEQDKIPRSTVVTFHEDEEVVEMNVVDAGEFPSPSERDNDESEANQDLTDEEEGEEEGEISITMLLLRDWLEMSRLLSSWSSGRRKELWTKHLQNCNN